MIDQVEDLMPEVKQDRINIEDVQRDEGFDGADGADDAEMEDFEEMIDGNEEY